MLTQTWNSLVRTHWAALVSGEKIWIEIPINLHPRLCSMFRQNTGWPDGQTCDYTISYRDGSRLHVQCFGAVSGLIRLRLHRDRYDPDQGLWNLMLHGLLETPAGPLLAGVALVASMKR